MDGQRHGAQREVSRAAHNEPLAGEVDHRAAHGLGGQLARWVTPGLLTQPAQQTGDPGGPRWLEGRIGADLHGHPRTLSTVVKLDVQPSAVEFDGGIDGCRTLELHLPDHRRVGLAVLHDSSSTILLDCDVVSGPTFAQPWTQPWTRLRARRSSLVLRESFHGSPRSAPVTAWETHVLRETPCSAAARSAWSLTWSINLRVIRLMSPPASPKCPGPNGTGPASWGGGGVSVRGPGCVSSDGELTAIRTSRPSSRTSTTRSSSAAVTSAARSDIAFMIASRAAGSSATPSTAAVRRVCSSPADAAAVRSSRS